MWLILFKLRWALLVILALSTFATASYVTFENYGWIDAIYMTVITLGTVGYGEIKPLDTSGRALTIGIIIIGFTTFVYASNRPQGPPRTIATSKAPAASEASCPTLRGDASSWDAPRQSAPES